MRDRDERTVLGLDPDHDVGGGEVREELSVPGETVEPFDIAVVQAPLGMGEITEG